MKNYKLWFSAILMVTLFACEVTDDVEDIENDDTEVTFEVLSYNDRVGVYDSLIIRGSFSEDLPEPTILISGDNDYELEFVKASTTELAAFIPKEVEAGDYELSFTVDEMEVTNDITGEALMVTMQDRPLITSISSKSFSAGAEITVQGGPFVNESGNNSYDPTVWFMKTSYTNTVSEIVVNEAGDQATIIVDSDLEPGEYKFYITADQDSEYYTQWSNELKVTVE